MLHRIGLLALLLSVCIPAGAASSPKPAKSKYLVTTGAGFTFAPDQGVRYGMSYMLRSFPLPDLYVVSIFENPEDPGLPLQVETKVEAGRNEFTLDSPFFRKIRNNSLYTVNLFIYADSSHTVLWGKHQQKVLFSIPRDMASEAQRRFGVVVP